MEQPNENFQVDLEKAISQYADMIYRIAVTITGNKADADDVLQETFLRLVKNQAKIQSEEHLKAWLIRVAGNCAKTMVMSPWNQKTQGLKGEDAGKIQETSEKQNRLLMELHMLPQKYSLVLYLFYYEGYSVKEIAKLLKKNENSIKTLLKRGRNLLKKSLEEGGEGNA
ncbi:MAG: RNA polymerase sigma factor [Lachnospiraceae bacterium]|nr:RNA polymerase sigma factor [Lachnospiraceae bacterium]